MHKERMLAVADAIEKENVVFDMSMWRSSTTRWGVAPSCGTVACMGGTAEHLMRQEGLVPVFLARQGMTRTSVSLVAEWLGIKQVDAYDLFAAAEFEHTGNKYGYINNRRHLVPDAIRWMAESGELSWAKGFEYAECVAKEKK